MSAPVTRGLTDAAAERADHPALVLQDGATHSYAELERDARGLAAGLARRGVGAGDRIGLLAQNGADFVRAVHAATCLGATLVMLSTRLGARELAPQLEDADPRLVLCDADLEGAARAALADPARAAPFEELDRALDPGPALAPPQGARADRAILFTSGTSGRAKGVRLSHAALQASATASAERLGVREADRWLACMPLFHVGGLAIVVRSALYGTTIVVHERFDTERVARALAREDITIVSLVPTMLGRLLAVLPEAPRGLRCALVGGGPTSPELLARARAGGWPVAPTYGLTEAASQVATAAPEDPAPGAPPLPGTELRILSAHGEPLPAGAEGEIAVRGPQLMTGYLGLPEASVRALRGGWLHTGDIGRLDARGRLHVLDRRSDLVVTGGENVYPTEVEAVLGTHPLVRDAAVIGRSDGEWGQRVVALIVPAPGSRPEPAVLAAHCRERLAGFKVPTRFELVASLPRTSGGKLRRAALREDAAPERGA